MNTATEIKPDRRPRLPRGVRLMQHEAHGWVLVAPERVFKADPIAVEILKRCDGTVTVEQIVADLAATFEASRERILNDVIAMLQSLAEKRLLEF